MARRRLRERRLARKILWRRVTGPVVVEVAAAALPSAGVVVVAADAAGAVKNLKT